MTTKQPNQSSGPRKWSQLSWQILPAVSFALLLLASWRRWMPLISDTGRELDLPQRLLEGQVLYRDIHYMYPPLSPYFFAFLYRVFGSRVEVLNAAGIVGSILVIILCSGLAKRLLTLPARSIAVSSVIVWCIFKPEGNLVSPYSFSALIGMVLALSTLAVSLQYVDHPSIRSAFIAGILIGLAGITKQEFALTAALTWTASVIFVRRRNISKVVAETAVAAAISILIAIPVYYHFISTLGLDLLIRDCHLLYTSIPASLVFYMDGRGGHPVVQKDAAGERMDRIQKLMDAGVGWVNMHYAVDYLPQHGKRVLGWMGGYYEPDYSINPHWDAEVRALPKHPITRGVKPFTINDEWYYNMRFVDEMKNVTPILTAIPPSSSNHNFLYAWRISL